MKKNNFKKIIGVATVTMVLALGSISVFATDYWGNSETYSAGSYTARHASYMTIDGYAQARTIIKSDSGKSLPPGTMGVKPRAYYSSGSLAKGGSWSYTDTASSSFDCPVSIKKISGYVYSQGQTALWNGKSYTTKSTTASPNADVSGYSRVSKSTGFEIKENENGQTYGPALFSLEDPDLILATGTDGTEGYVKDTDLNGDIAKSPEEAIEIMKTKNNESKLIPLYDSTGENVIGEFEISPREE
ncbi:MAG: hypothetical protein AB9836_08650 [Aminipila sp.]